MGLLLVSSNLPEQWQDNNPYKTHVVNNGFDGTGEHCGDRDQNYPFDKDYNLKRTKNFVMDSSKKS